jgi:hypothetical protein
MAQHDPEPIGADRGESLSVLSLVEESVHPSTGGTETGSTLLSEFRTVVYPCASSEVHVNERVCR